MVKFMVSPQIPPVYLKHVAREAGMENPAYSEWEEQDSLLCIWILSTISPSILLHFIWFRNFWQVSGEIRNYYFMQMRTRSRQLCYELCTVIKGSRKISEFISRVRDIFEALMSIGDPVPHRDLIEVVLEALPEEFNAVVASVNRKTEIILLDERFKKAVIT